jgi:hypothetical protein
MATQNLQVLSTNTHRLDHIRTERFCWALMCLRNLLMSLVDVSVCLLLYDWLRMLRNPVEPALCPLCFDLENSPDLPCNAIIKYIWREGACRPPTLAVPPVFRVKFCGRAVAKCTWRQLFSALFINGSRKKFSNALDSSCVLIFMVNFIGRARSQMRLSSSFGKFVDENLVERLPRRVYEMHSIHADKFLVTES